MPPTDAAALDDGLEDSDEEDGDKIPEEVHQANLLKACRENNLEAVKESLGKCLNPPT
jgi:hypothetical protein